MSALNITLKVQPTADKPVIYKLVRGSFGPDNVINFTIQTSLGGVYDLTGKTASLILLHKVTKNAVFDKGLTIVAPASGTAKYEPKEGDFSFLNIYYLRLRIKDVDNETFTERVLFQVV